MKVMTDVQLRAFAHELAAETVRRVTARAGGWIEPPQVASLTFSLTEHYRKLLTDGDPALSLRPIIREAKTENLPLGIRKVLLP